MRRTGYRCGPHLERVVGRRCDASVCKVVLPLPWRPRRAGRCVAPPPRRLNNHKQNKTGLSDFIVLDSRRVLHPAVDGVGMQNTSQLTSHGASLIKERGRCCCMFECVLDWPVTVTSGSGRPSMR